MAGFIGNPRMYTLPVTCRGIAEGGVAVDLPGGERLTVPVAGGAAEGQAMVLDIRPEHVRFRQGDAVLGAVPSVIERLGIHTVAHCSAAASDAPFTALPDSAVPAQVGKEMPLRLMADDCHLFDGEGRALERRIPLTEIDPTLLAASA